MGKRRRRRRGKRKGMRRMLRISLSRKKRESRIRRMSGRKRKRSRRRIKASNHTLEKYIFRFLKQYVQQLVDVNASRSTDQMATWSALVEGFYTNLS